MLRKNLHTFDHKHLWYQMKAYYISFPKKHNILRIAITLGQEILKKLTPTLKKS